VILVLSNVKLVLTPPLVILVLIPIEVPPNVLVMPELSKTWNLENVNLVLPNVLLALTRKLVTPVKKTPETYLTVNVEMDSMMPPELVNP